MDELSFMFTTMEEIAPLSLMLREQLSLCMIPQTFARRSYLAKAGKESKHLFFIVKGLVRCYTHRDNALTDDVHEISKWFMPEGGWISALHCKSINASGDEYLQAMEPTVVLKISQKDYDDLMMRFPEFHHYAYVLVIRCAIMFTRIADMLRLVTAQERWQYLQMHYTGLLNRVEQKYLASFMGINESTLSKIKALKNGPNGKLGQ